MKRIKHSQDFILKKLQRVKKQIVRLQQERVKLTNQYLSMFPKEVMNILKAEIEQQENE